VAGAATPAGVAAARAGVAGTGVSAAAGGAAAMDQLTRTLLFATRLYRNRAALALAGYARRDPFALLALRPGRDDPYAIYARMRRAGTMAPTRLGNWVTTSHRLCTAVLRDRRFGVRPDGAPPPEVASDEVNLSFLELNPPDHTRLRRLAQPAFSPRQMAGYRPRIEHTVATLLDRVPPGAPFDLVPALAAPLPIAVITDLLGIPDAEAGRFARYGTVIGGALDGVRSLSHAARLQRANLELRALFEELFALRRREPADDIVGRMVAAEGVAVRPAEMLPMCTLLLIAGFETTVNLIGNAVNALLEHPDQWQALCADPAGLAGPAIEETLRFDPPVQRTGRVALQRLELDGRPVHKGQTVITLIGAANRDPEVFADPDRFDIRREQTAEHLAFSGGIHYCVGQPLALLEATTALRCLAERMPGLRRAGATRRRTSTTIRGPIHLPVRTPTR
jgi:P450-derived glycosyltransferase activator